MEHVPGQHARAVSDRSGLWGKYPVWQGLPQPSSAPQALAGAGRRAAAGPGRAATTAGVWGGAGGAQAAPFVPHRPSAVPGSHASPAQRPAAQNAAVQLQPPPTQARPAGAGGASRAARAAEPVGVAVSALRTHGAAAGRADGHGAGADAAGASRWFGRASPAGCAARAAELVAFAGFALVPAQQPWQFVVSQTQAPLRHRWPAAQVAQAAPFAPQESLPVPRRHSAPAQQPNQQLAAVQVQAPPTHS